jgi:hypothetical protein
MHTKKDLWTLSVLTAALVCSGVWASIDHFGGYLSRGLGWEHFPINIVIGAEVFIWAAALWLFDVIDENRALIAASLGSIVFFGPHLAASWNFTTSVAVYNKLLSMATIWATLFAIIGAAIYDVAFGARPVTASHANKS